MFYAPLHEHTYRIPRLHGMMVLQLIDGLNAAYTDGCGRIEFVWNRLNYDELGVLLAGNSLKFMFFFKIR
ncbi:unnamed protein product [Callosobruchus maculatus]|uniref:Uncharacterized protein n=1 Tax=Callosobruchus maculatus TaxID=64391 RepID=A0A653DW51_CALMS|nr:unnamed protein product [Callosobruchus maculatus]